MKAVRYTATTTQVQVYVTDVKASDYPKSYRVRNYTLEDFYSGNVLEQGVHLQVDLSSDEVNKGKNETGLKRLEKFIKRTKQIFGEIELVRERTFDNDIEIF